MRRSLQNSRPLGFKGILTDVDADGLPNFDRHGAAISYAPDWLPEDAVAYADLTGSNAYAGGEEVTFSDLFGVSNEGGAGAGSFDADDITGAGMLIAHANTNRPGAAGDFKAALLADHTIILDVVVTSAGEDHFPNVLTYETSNGSSVKLDVMRFGNQLNLVEPGGFDVSTGDFLNATLAKVAIAIDYANGTAYGSINGSEAVGGELVMTGTGSVSFGYNLQDGQSILIKTITVLPLVASADLSALSAP